MQNAARILIVVAGAVALIGCHKQQPKAAENDDLAIESNLPGGEVPPNAQIETLPPDESSVTSNSDLAAGSDQPEINGAGNSTQPH
jgi:hypothetical protein